MNLEPGIFRFLVVEYFSNVRPYDHSDIKLKIILRNSDTDYASLMKINFNYTSMVEVKNA